MSKRYIVIFVLFYVNGVLYFGYFVGVYFFVDIYVCYFCLFGRDVVWVCGFDEYGVVIIIWAKKEGIFFQVIIDKYYGFNKQIFE